MNSAASVGWQAHSDDPQFFITPKHPEILSQAGWLIIEYQFDCDEPTTHQVYLNRGKGYETDLVVTKEGVNGGPVMVVLRSPGDLAGLRLDPAMSEVSFRIDNVKLRWVADLPRGFSDDAPWLSHYFAMEAGEAGCHFLPVNQVRRIIDGAFHWHAEGNDPYFTVMHGGKNIQLVRGWYQCRVHLAFPRKRQLARFYFDAGNGFNEKDSLVLLVSNDELHERLVFLPDGARAIRFDPQEKSGPFRVDGVSFTPTDEASAVDEAVRRIQDSVDGFGGVTSEAVVSELSERAEKLGETFHERLNAVYQESFIEPPGTLEYEEWIQDVELPSLPSDEAVADMLARTCDWPLISVIVPVYNTDEPLLRRCLESVLAQSYANWELCIADDASPEAHVAEVLKEYEACDSRIRVVYRSENGHISEASNSALEIAKGDYVALLDHDDELAEHALLYVAEAIHESANAAVLYSDEDKIDTAGRRFDPHFKSKWNPDLFFSQNYVSHLGVYRTALLKKIGGFRKGLEGSQDQDLLLRCLPYVDKSQIIHIPRVLYHWRSVEGSTAMSAGEKCYTSAAGLKALADYFAEHGPAGTEVMDGLVPNTYRVKWPVPEPEPLVSLLIPTRDRKDLTEVAVRSILDKTTYQNYELLILDNGSVEKETLKFFEEIQREESRVKVLEYDYPFNYSAINNYGVKHSQGSIIGLINNDIEVISPGWLTEMVAQACRQEIGCVGAKLYYSNDTVQHAGVILGLGGVAGHSHKYSERHQPGYFHRLMLPQNLSAVTAACLLVRKDLYEAVDGLDETNLTIAFNDVDFCLKVASAGYRNIWSPYAELYHHESVSRGQEDSPEKIRRFQRELKYMRERWGDYLDADPYYNQNLTRDREDFSIGR
ncbi:MAG: glycosyltransferase family 2 protein [Pseudomonadota bacterium]